MATATAPRMRWSSARVCARKAIYEATGAPARDRTDREERILFRGKSLGTDYADWLERQHGAASVEREVAVQWEFGTGHIDIVLHTPDGPACIEVLSSAHATDRVRDSKLRQLVGYMRHYPGADTGALVILNPSDFSEDRVVIHRHSALWNELEADVHRIVDRLDLWAKTGDMPDRVCPRPKSGEAWMCPHAAHCFDGWEPPDTDVIDRPDVVEWAARWETVKRAEREAASIVKRLEDERKTIEAEADDLDIPAGEHHAGPYTIKRTHVVRQPTVDAKKVKAALAHVPDDWWKPGSEYDRWAIERADTTAPVDYGDDAPF